jgi:hypothetical protein
MSDHDRFLTTVWIQSSSSLAAKDPNQAADAPKFKIEPILAILVLNLPSKNLNLNLIRNRYCYHYTLNMEYT